MVPEMPAWLEMISALARLRPPHLLVTCCYQVGLAATGQASGEYDADAGADV